MAFDQYYDVIVVGGGHAGCSLKLSVKTSAAGLETCAFALLNRLKANITITERIVKKAIFNFRFLTVLILNRVAFLL